MTELKTLKDCDNYGECSCCINREQLKAEAVKWVKEGNSRPLKFDWEWAFKHFFNLTEEEDLK